MCPVCYRLRSVLRMIIRARLDSPVIVAYSDVVHCPPCRNSTEGGRVVCLQVFAHTVVRHVHRNSYGDHEKKSTYLIIVYTLVVMSPPLAILCMRAHAHCSLYILTVARQHEAIQFEPRSRRAAIWRRRRRHAVDARRRRRPVAVDARQADGTIVRRGCLVVTRCRDAPNNGRVACPLHDRTRRCSEVRTSSC